MTLAGYGGIISHTPPAKTPHVRSANLVDKKHTPITVSVKTAGEMLGLSAWQVKGLCDRGLIDSGFSGRTRLVKVSSIQAYADGLPSERPELSA